MISYVIFIIGICIFGISNAAGFVMPILSIKKQHHNQIIEHSSSISSSTTSLANSPLFSDESNNSKDDNDEFDGFNPFQPGAKIKTKGGFGILSDDDRKQQTQPTPGGQVSPRQMRMKEITTDLLMRLSDDDAVYELLQSNEDFLLQQLNDLDISLESDSVYTPDMNREERFTRYREVMDERIENARAPAAKKALSILYDFVSSRE
jgi:hypothetical protein